MNTDDNDIVKINLPPYEEEQSPFPDVETEASFEENKEEIYRRNRIIAAEQQTAFLKEEERRKAEKREQYRKAQEKSERVQLHSIIPIEFLPSVMIVILFIAVIVSKFAMLF